MDRYVPYPGVIRTAKDFKVGDPAVVRADQGIRVGVVVTKVARTRIHIRHPRNKQGDMVERAYSMDDVVVGQIQVGRGWTVVWATGQGGDETWGRDVPYRVPVITEPKAPYRRQIR